MSETYITKSAEETARLGNKLGKTLKGSELILLTGELGCGKTQFTKGIARALGIADTVVSPTFTIERVYHGSFKYQASSLEVKTLKHEAPGPEAILHHFDLYRTHEDREILEQIKEYSGSRIDVTVVEWPENLAVLSGYNHILVSFDHLDDNERKIVITKVGDEWS